MSQLARLLTGMSDRELFEAEYHPIRTPADITLDSRLSASDQERVLRKLYVFPDEVERRRKELAKLGPVENWFKR